MSASDEKSHAEVLWQNGVPVSKHFDDVYYSRENGLEETRHVFINANRLSERWQASKPEHPFTIAETGFGTGLNFLVCLQTWLDLPLPKPRLYFLSVEKYPLSASDLERALEPWAGALSGIPALIEQYPTYTCGQHQLTFAEGQVTLGLVFGDVIDVLSQQAYRADAWFLDGFAPSKNPQMWQPDLYRIMARHSSPHATVATFTAAGHVRRGLIAEGFAMQRAPGFGRKRDMLVGQRSVTEHSEYYADATPNWQRPAVMQSTKAESDHSAIVVGGGLAGICTALSLIKTGFSVTLLEANESLLSAASGQKQLALYAKLPALPNQEARFILQGMQYSYAFFNYWQKQLPKYTFWYPTGLLQLCWNEKESSRQRLFSQNYAAGQTPFQLVDSDFARKISGLELSTGGLWSDLSGWLSPDMLGKAIHGLAGLRIVCSTRVTDIARDKDKQVWVVNSDHTTFHASTLVLATANHCGDFFDARALPTKPLRGQISKIPSIHVTPPKTVVCGEGYLCPALDEHVHFGATYSLDDPVEILKEQDDEKNIIAINKWLPGWLPPSRSNTVTSASAGLRCTTPDYHPMVGHAPDTEAFIREFSMLRNDAKSCQNKYGCYLENCYIHAGLGSKGMLSAPMGGGIIAALASRQPCPVDHTLFSMMHPARFLVRKLKRKQL